MENKNRRKIDANLLREQASIQAVKREKDAITDELVNLYKEQTDCNVDLTTVAKASRRGRWVFWGVVLLVLAVALALSALSWYFFTNKQTFTGENILIDISTNEEFISGDEVVYVIQYSNIEAVSIKDIEISMRYPIGFVFETAIPEPIQSNNVWRLDYIASRQSGEIKIKGRLIGEPGSAKTLTSRMTYTPTNFSSEFQVIGSVTSKVSEVPISFSLSGPQSVLLGEEVRYVIEYENKLAGSLEDVRVDLIVPDLFTVADSLPQLKDFDKKKYWQLVDINRDGKIEFTGTFDSVKDSLQEIKVVFSLGVNGTYYPQLEKLVEVEVMKSDLEVDLVQNGSYDNNYLTFGEDIRYLITIKNTTDALMEDIEVALNINTTQPTREIKDFKVLNWDDISLSYEGKITNQEVDINSADIEKKIIIWDEGDIIQLNELEPDQEVEIPVHIKILDADIISRDYNISNLAGIELENYVQVYVGRISGKNNSVNRRSNKITNKIFSDISLTGTVRYYDEDSNEIGTGPMPPKVGEKTVYKVHWSLQNSVHEIRDIYIINILDPDTIWEDNVQVDAGELIYNEDNHAITWNILKMPIAVREITADFDIGILPVAGDVDDVKVILPKTSVKAYDAVIKDEIIIISAEKTTVLEDDPTAKGKGLVVE